MNISYNQIKKFVIISVFAFLTLLCLSAHTKWTHNKIMKQLAINCDKTESSKYRIFVALLSEYGVEQCAECLLHIFDNAFCPNRVTVAVYFNSTINQTHYNSEEDIVHAYKTLAEKKSKIGNTFESQIIIMRRDAFDDGPYGALRDVFEYNYGKEEYVMTLSDIAILHANWDRELLSFYESKPLSNVALVITPSQKRSFSFFDSFNAQEMPVISLKKAPESKKDAILPAKFWLRECTFTSSKFWKDIFKNSPLIKHLYEGTNFLISCLGYKNGWRFVHPNNLVIYDRSNLKVGKQSAWNVQYNNAQVSKAHKTAIQIFSSDLLKPVLKIMGIENGIVHSTAFLGIVDELNNEELIHKYGSRADFFYWKSKIEKF